MENHYPMGQTILQLGTTLIEKVIFLVIYLYLPLLALLLAYIIKKLMLSQAPV